MTKKSANPRRYSRGSAALDPTQPLAVFMAVHVQRKELLPTIRRIEQLAALHPDAFIDLAGLRYEGAEIVITIEIDMGPARQALRGESIRLVAGYDLLWDLVKTLYYATPVLCGPPHASDRAMVDQMGELPKFRQPDLSEAIPG